jgi:hypothetical protein
MTPDINEPMSPQPSPDQKIKAISVKYGGSMPGEMTDASEPKPEPSFAFENLDGSHLERIKEAQKYHSPIEAKIRDYEQRAAQVKAASESPAQAAQPIATNATQDGTDTATASPQPQGPQEIVEGDKTYTVEQRPQGYFMTKATDRDGKSQVYDEPVFLGEKPPEGTQQSFMDKVKDLTLKDVASGAGEAVKGAFVGADIGLIKLATNAVRTLVDNPLGKYALGDDNVEAYNTFTNWLGDELDKARAQITKDTTAGKVGAFVGEAGGNFVAPALGAYSKLRTLGASPLLAAALGDVGIAVFGVNPDQENLSSLLSDDEDSKLKPFRDLMATDPNDPSWMNRARNATEALITIGVAEAGAQTIVKIVREVNKFAKDVNIPPQFMDTLEKFIKDESGSLTIGGKKNSLPMSENLNWPRKPTEKEMRDLSKVSDVPLDMARGTQSKMYWDDFNANKGETAALLSGFEDMPVAARLENGEYIIFDGHHRTVKAIQDGKTNLKMHVIDAKKYDPENAGRKKQPVKKEDVDNLMKDLGAYQRPEVIDKAIASLGPIKPGEMAIADKVVAEMRAAADAGDFVGFGLDARQGADFNLARMQNSEEIGDLINKVSEVYADPIYKAKRGVQTFDETQAKADLAREMGFDVADIINRPDGTVWNAEKLKAARDIFVGEAEKTRALADAIKQPGGDSQEALIAFRRQLAVLAAVQMQIKGAQTEAARALAQFRMTAKSPLEASANIRDLLDRSGGHEVNSNIVDAFLNLANSSNDAASMARFARHAQEINGADMLYEAWINSLLGAPTTHIVNIQGNALAAGQGVVERYAAAAYGAGERTALRMMGQTPTPGGIGFAEANAYSRGMAFGVWDALRMSGKAFKAGEGSDVFNKLGYGDKITAQNINELPISKSISGLLGKDELLKTNGQMALLADRLGEWYFRLPGRFLMAEDEFFKTLTYRAEVNAQSAREAMSLNFTPEQAAARRAEIMADPQVAAPSIHLASVDNAREFTFTQPAGEFAGAFQKTLIAGKIGDIPVGRVVIPFFNVINNITKFVGSRTPGLALLNPRSNTYKDLFSGDPAKRQLVLGKWATGGAIAGWAAWMNQNGVMTGRLSDSPKIRNQMMQQGKAPYSVMVPMADGTHKMVQFNRLEPIGMIMGIAATTSEVMNHLNDEEAQQNLVIAATSAILPYLEDKSFFKGATDFANALFPQYGEDDARAKAMSKYFIGLGASAPGAILGPLAPGTPLSRWARKEIAGDEKLRKTEPDPYRVVKDQWGEDALVPNDEFSYRTWEGIVKKIMDATPGLSEKLPPRTNLWGEDVVLENGIFSASSLSPIISREVKYDVNKLRSSNLPDPIKNGYFNGVMIGRDMTLEQFKTFIDIVGIDGELERLGVPVTMPQKQISAKNGTQNIGLPVKMNEEQYYKYMQILNKISVPNEADSERRSMNMRQMMDWAVRQPEYATLPEDGDARKAKGDILNQIAKKYRNAADNLFLETPDGKLLRKRSILLQLKAQNTGAQ